MYGQNPSSCGRQLLSSNNSAPRCSPCFLVPSWWRGGDRCRRRRRLLRRHCRLVVVVFLLLLLLASADTASSHQSAWCAGGNCIQDCWYLRVRTGRWQFYKSNRPEPNPNAAAPSDAGLATTPCVVYKQHLPNMVIYSLTPSDAGPAAYGPFSTLTVGSPIAPKVCLGVSPAPSHN